MTITPHTTLHSLLKEYPFLTDYLADYHPEFKKLANPLLRRTMARVTTMERVAVLGEVPVDRLLRDIAAEVRRVTGEAPEPSGAERARAAAEGAHDQAVDPAERQEILKGIIRDLHAGHDMDELKTRFATLIEDVEATEIAAMEQRLIEEGMSEQEVKRLCGVHVQVFADSLDEHESVSAPAGHPIDTFERENQALRQVLQSLRKVRERVGKPPRREEWERLAPAFRSAFERVREVEKHYLRKENQLFPFLERHGVAGPSKVMWALHDDIRAVMRELRGALERQDADEVVQHTDELLTMADDMIYKEEKILFPMAMDSLSDEEWAEIRRGEPEIGYALIGEPSGWPNIQMGEQQGGLTAAGATASGAAAGGARVGGAAALPLDTGALTHEQINLMLRGLPVDVTYVDENDEVRYYSEGERIFPRSPGVIGRKVQNCHPPASVHKVQEIVAAFRAGEKSVAEFWIQLEGRFIHIRYFALRDDDGTYRGTLEMVQDATRIRELEGQRRLIDWQVTGRPTPGAGGTGGGTDTSEGDA
jgi:hypothetical protein